MERKQYSLNNSRISANIFHRFDTSYPRAKLLDIKYMYGRMLVKPAGLQYRNKFMMSGDNENDEQAHCNR